MKTVDILATCPVFRADELWDVFPDLGHAAALKRVRYAVSTGRAIQLAHGIYASVPAGRDAARFQPDRFLVVSTLRRDVVICGHSALELLGIAQSEWSQCTGYTQGRTATSRLRGADYRLLPHPKRLVRQGRQMLGVIRSEREGREITFTGFERSLVDGFRAPRYFGGLDEMVTSAQSYWRIDYDLLREILEGYGSKRLFACTGWFLARNRERFSVGEPILDYVRQRLPTSARYMLRDMGPGEYDAKWRLVVPSRLVRAREGG